jgi:hypothetical protein
MGLNPISYYNPIIALPEQNSTSATAYIEYLNSTQIGKKQMMKILW